MRPPAHPGERLALAVDIGGTKTAVACVILPNCEVLDRGTRMTPVGAASGEAFLAELLRQAGEAERQARLAGWRSFALGISLCELVDLSGEPSSAHRVLWRGLAPQARFAALGPAVVESD